MINIAICDDETFAIEEIRRKVLDFFKKENIALRVECFGCGQSLIDSDSDFDIIFLDIRMNGKDGMETARQLRRNSFKGSLIFVTVMEECVFDSFEVQAYDYLVKPINDERLEKTLCRLMSYEYGSASENIIVHNGRDMKMIPPDDIVYCEVIDKKIYLHTVSGETTAYYERLERLENKLDKRFFKCHRSYLINLKYLSGFGGGTAKMKTGAVLPVSRLRQNGLAEAVARYMGKSGENI